MQTSEKTLHLAFESIGRGEGGRGEAFRQSIGMAANTLPPPALGVVEMPVPFFPLPLLLASPFPPPYATLEWEKGTNLGMPVPFLDVGLKNMREHRTYRASDFVVLWILLGCIQY